MSISRFSARSYELTDVHGAEVQLEGAFRYMARDFFDSAIAGRISDDVNEACQIAYRALFTDALAKQISEHHAAALEGALKGIRKRKLMDK